MVSGAGGVESEDFRAATEAGGGVRNPRGGLVQQRPYGFEVEAVRKFQSRDEGLRGHAGEGAGSAFGRSKDFPRSASIKSVMRPETVAAPAARVLQLLPQLLHEIQRCLSHVQPTSKRADNQATCRTVEEAGRLLIE